MALSAGRTTAINAVKSALQSAALETNPANKTAALTALATNIVDAVIALVQTGSVTVAVTSVSGVTTGGGVSGPGAGTGTIA